jgi:plasmid stabilization system protein ParE
MEFRVEFAARFFRDAELIADYVEASSGFATRAEKWTQGLFEACASLSTFPDRNPSLGLPRKLGDIRWIRYHSHRVIYEVLADRSIVVIHSIKPFAIPEAPEDVFDA